MTFDAPQVLVAGLLVVAGLAGCVVALARRRAAALPAAAGTGGRRGAQLGTWVTLTGVAVLALAAAGPVASLPVPRAAGTVVVTIDVSNSMAATDVAPNRLAAARDAALELIAAQPDRVDIGVVGFEQGGLTAAIPSADHTVAAAAVERLRPAGGTSLAAALLTALEAITGQRVAIHPGEALPDIGYWGSATIVLFSDGENEAGDPGQAALAAAVEVAQAAGVRIVTVGVGTAAGATIESDGYRLHTALDDRPLTMIAEITGGTYQTVADREALADLAGTINERLVMAHRDVPVAGAFICAAIILLSAGAVLTVMRQGRLV